MSAHATTPSPPRPGASLRLSAQDQLLALAAVAVLAVVIYGAVTTQGFLTTDNLKAILSSAGIVGIVAVGMTCITLGGNLFSLTLGTTAAVTTMAFLAALELGFPVAFVIALVLATTVCAAQGLVVGGLGANPIIVTIAFGALQLGLASLLSNNSTVYPPAGADYKFLAGTILGLPVSVFVLAAIAIAVELWLRRSRTGHELYLIGQNRAAARAGALRVVPVTVAAFAVAGACAGLAGVLIGANQGNATLLTGDIYTYDAIAAVLVGGTAITGGRGSVVRTVAGTLFIAVVADMLLLRGYSTGIQILVRGVMVLLVVVGMQLWLRRRSA
jgi:simple sugar transport system permease protein/ribose transport system permease protein